MIKPFTKSDLYQEIAQIKMHMGLEETAYGLNLVKYIRQMTDIHIEYLPFRTPGLRGMAVPGKDFGERDIILLNKNRNPIEQNFDCCHEMLHLALHREAKEKTFQCFDKIKPNQNAFLEWQANEGAAEFFLPLKKFLPLAASSLSYLCDPKSLILFKEELSETFFVPKTVVQYRLENLKYEISQFAQGIPLEEIQILSSAEQTKRHIHCVRPWEYK